MMSHAGRDPIFWSTVAIAEQDFDGSGDLCIRCHTQGGWFDGNSTPTDGSALTTAQADAGVECDLCHRMTNPDGSEHAGIRRGPHDLRRACPRELLAVTIRCQGDDCQRDDEHARQYQEPQGDRQDDSGCDQGSRECESHGDTGELHGHTDGRQGLEARDAITADRGT